MAIKPYCIGSSTWNGLSKLVEESGEVQQVLGKIVGVEGETTHFSGDNLKMQIEEELGNLLAAINFFIDENRLNFTRIQRQRDHKYNQFQEWNAERRGRK